MPTSSLRLLVSGDVWTDDLESCQGHLSMMKDAFSAIFLQIAMNEIGS
jgi:hypothetical protein